MTWTKLDDSFPEHPKIDALSDGAFRLHVSAICWSCKLLTDGFIPTEKANRLTPRYKPAHLTELTTNRPPHDQPLWEKVEGGWRIHDFLGYQQSAAQVKAERAENAERQRRWREARAKTKAGRNARTNAGSHAVTDGPRNGDVTPLVTGAVTGAPSRPVPTRSGSKSRSSPKEAGGDPATPGTAHAEDQGFGHPEATGPDETTDDQLTRRNLALRWQDVLLEVTGNEPDLAACNAAVAQALHHADPRIVDEQIGWQLTAITPPRTPNALVTAVQRMTTR